LNRLAILGASGHGKVVADTAECAGWKEIDFYDDAWPEVKFNGVWSVIGNTEALLNDLSKYDGVVIAIGDNAIRVNKYKELSSYKIKFVNIIHPAAQVSQYVELGLANVIMAGAIINADSILGDCCIINTGSIIEHDCKLADGVHVSPGAHLAGGVIIGDSSWVGMGANILQSINIESNVLVGAGSVVINNIKEGCTVVGIPAKIIKNK